MLATRLCAILVVLPLAVSGLSMVAPEDPCKQWYNSGNTCEVGKVCRLVKVQCVKAPCEPQPQCVDVATAPKGGCDYGDAVIDASGNKVPCSGCPDTTACADNSKDCCWQAPDPPTWPPCFNCKVGEQCLPTPCAPGSLPSDCYACVESTDPCAKCKVGEQCLPTPCAAGSPPSSCYACVEQLTNPCAVMLCRVGHTCEVRPIKGCIGPSCAVEGVCVPTNPCGECKPGYHCERQTQCEPGPSDPPKPCTDVFQCVKSAPNPGVCPAVAPGTIGTCAEECSHDGNCAENEKCCSNGCGHVCRRSVEPVPHPCIYARCSRETECRLQEYCEDGICSAGANCVLRKCDYGQPLVGNDSVALFCGRGPGRVECPEGSSCNIDEVDRFAVCCPNEGTTIVEQCPVGLPVVNAANTVLFCGEGKNSVKCPEGTFCNSETDVCCHQQVPEPSKCPSGEPEIKGVYCGRGGKICPNGSYCETHPADQYAVCCPKPPSPCESAKCDDGEECEEVVHPCLVPPCPVGHRCVRQEKNGACPVPPSNQFGHCANMCTGDHSCKGTQKCCSNGCGNTCQAARATFDDSDPCSRKTCKGNKVCRLRQVRCIRGRCPRPLRRVCLATSSVAESKICKSGYPLLNTDRTEMNCENCPENSVCDNGVCCWKSGNSNPNQDPCSQKVCGETKVCQLREPNCKKELTCPPRARCVDKKEVSDPSSCKSGYPVIDRRGRQICSHDDQIYCPTGTIPTDGVCCWSPGKPVALPVQKPNVLTEKTYLPSDPCNNKNCSRNRVCRLVKGALDSLPIARCIRKTSLVGSKSCISGYPVQDIGTWRPICCDASSDACPKKTVCMAGVCCWDRANDGLKG